jgi:hypothetical protein
MMEAIGSFETSAVTRATRLHIAESDILHCVLIDISIRRIQALSLVPTERVHLHAIM